MLEAALRLFAERGFESTSMDAIAHQSGVSKPTLYNHWADKEALMMEVMLYVNGALRQPEDIDTGSVTRDISYILTRRPPDEFEDLRSRMMPGLIIYSANHPEFGAAWRRNIMGPPADELRRILHRAVRRGQLRKSLDMDVSICLLLGPMLYRHIFEANSRLTVDVVGRKVADSFVRAFRPSR